ncbi:CBO0543 family protein [Texcoconibacillus texcoconensis]|uniref:Uncharacterized protein n=1 Tax=Texcoconibacillus texcoconensis TaxID=1095777 RepID=A0A840QIP2_9BACI|nr:hypothetical protein [Texcoconibacillus texcoconensis]
MKQKHLALILSLLLLNILRGSWRDIPKYYKNLTYVIFVNILYYLVCRRHLLWEFPSLGVNRLVLRVAYVIFVTPSIVLAFLSKFPKSPFRQILYISKWVIVSSMIEYFLHKRKLIQYKHGWNIYWSGLVYLKMFVYSSIFHKKPLIVWLLTFCSLIYFIVTFQIPVFSKHTFSRKFDRIIDYFYHSFLEDVF